MKWNLEVVNERLRAGRIGVKVCQRGDRLSLRATLPPKPDSQKTNPHQQYLALGIYANVAGLQRAEAEAKIVGGLLATNSFDWGRYLEREPSNVGTCGYWVEKFKIEYFASNGNSITTQQTWKNHYQSCFSKLPQDEPLTREILVATAIQTEANTWTRRRTCQKFEQLAKLADVACDLKKYHGNYGSNSQVIRQLPTEEEIIANREKITNPSWLWVFGAIACYGLRPHEALFCEVEQAAPHRCKILDGKTGSRLAYPLPVEWVTDWQLWQMDKPTIKTDGRTWKDIGSAIYKSLKRYKISFAPYDLRHAWAVRAALKYKIPTSVAAKWMGHSTAVHLEEYQRHITDADHLEIFSKFTST
jgi:hypothetical protein